HSASLILACVASDHFRPAAFLICTLVPSPSHFLIHPCYFILGSPDPLLNSSFLPLPFRAQDDFSKRSRLHDRAMRPGCFRQRKFFADCRTQRLVFQTRHERGVFTRELESLITARSAKHAQTARARQLHCCRPDTTARAVH